MSFIETASDYIHKWFFKKDVICLSDCVDLINDTCYKELALHKVISLLSGSFVNTKLRTYKNHMEVNGSYFYKLNYSPNQNQNKYDFYKKFVTKLIRNQEALMFVVNNNLYIADKFTKHKSALNDYSFDEIELDGYSMKDKFFSSDVMYFSLNDERLNAVINSINSNYSRLLNALENAYVRNKLRKVIVNMDSTSNLRDGKDNDTQELINNIIKPFVEGERSVLTLPKGFSLTSIDDKQGKANDSVSEMTDAGKEIFEKIASIFDIPVDLLYGNKNELDEQEKMYMTHAFKPFAMMFSTEFTRKAYSKSQILNGTYMSMDLVTTEFVNILKSADSLDKLFRIGFSNNFLRDKLGEEKTEDEWANKSYVTKNYMTAEGGEESNEEYIEHNQTVSK